MKKQSALSPKPDSGGLGQQIYEMRQKDPDYDASLWSYLPLIGGLIGGGTKTVPGHDTDMLGEGAAGFGGSFGGGLYGGGIGGFLGALLSKGKMMKSVGRGAAGGAALGAPIGSHSAVQDRRWETPLTLLELAQLMDKSRNRPDRANPESRESRDYKDDQEKKKKKEDKDDKKKDDKKEKKASSLVKMALSPGLLKALGAGGIGLGGAAAGYGLGQMGGGGEGAPGPAPEPEGDWMDKTMDWGKENVYDPAWEGITGASENSGTRKLLTALLLMTLLGGGGYMYGKGKGKREILDKLR